MLFVLEFAASLLILAGVVTQVCIPLWRGTILFPIVRAQSTGELAAAREEVDQAAIDREVESLRQRAAMIRPAKPQGKRPSKKKSK